MNGGQGIPIDTVGVGLDETGSVAVSEGGGVLTDGVAGAVVVGAVVVGGGVLGSQEDVLCGYDGVASVRPPVSELAGVGSVLGLEVSDGVGVAELDDCGCAVPG